MTCTSNLRKQCNNGVPRYAGNPCGCVLKQVSMRLRVSVILLVAKLKERPRSHPKGIGNVASRQGLSYCIGHLCSRRVGRDQGACVRCRLEWHPVPEGLHLGSAWAGDRRADLGMVIEDCIEGPLRAGHTMCTQARAELRAGGDVLSSFY